MKRYIALILLVSVLAAGCGEEKKDEKKALVPPAGDMFDKSKPQKGKKPGPKPD